MYITILRIYFSRSILRGIYVYKKGVSWKAPIGILTNYIVQLYEVLVIFFVVGLYVFYFTRIHRKGTLSKKN